MKKRSLTTEERRREVAQAMSKNESGIHVEAQGSVLIGHLARLTCLLVLFQQSQQGDAQSSLVTHEMAQAIESELLETVSLMTSTFEQQRMLIPGSKGFTLTIVSEIPFDLDDIVAVHISCDPFGLVEM